MLKLIDNILSPELLYALRDMGHGDELAIVDANYPAGNSHDRVFRMDGHSVPRVLDAILQLMPLDDFVDDPAVRMEIAGEPNRMEPVMNEFAGVLAKHEPKVKLKSMERFAFYERVKRSYGIVATGEPRLYGNIIIKMGVIRP